MKPALISLFAGLALFDQPAPAIAGNPAAPEVVHLEKIEPGENDLTIRVGNAKGTYTLTCNRKAEGCAPPSPTQDYYVFNKDTRWKMPGATREIDLAFIQDWTVKYNRAENIGLVPVNANGQGHLGMFMLDDWTASHK
jgi:hypothetical protein